MCVAAAGWPQTIRTTSSRPQGPVWPRIVLASLSWSPGGKVRFMTYAKTMNAALFLVFLGRLLRSTTGKVFLILDHLKAHETKVVEDWVAAHQDRLELFWLPSRSPELNADEYLNQDLKGNVNAEGLPDNKRKVRSRIQRFDAQVASSARTCQELLPTSLRSVLRMYISSNNITCRCNTYTNARDR